MTAWGERKRARGEPVGQRGRPVKLSPADVLRLREFDRLGYDLEWMTIVFGVSRWTIRRALNRRRSYATNGVPEVADKLGAEWAKAPPGRRPYDV